jgi:hypothetical protein
MPADDAFALFNTAKNAEIKNLGFYPLVWKIDGKINHNIALKDELKAMIKF